ncbi:MAG TPA: DUF4038 domain-containing protein [Acidimicrobiales bacterium]
MWVAATVAAALVVAACGGSPSHAKYDIAPTSVVLSPGQSTQLSVSGNTDVVWGLEEAGTGTTGATATTPTYPLKVSANGRYLVDAQDQPWRIQADAAWLISSEATPEQLDAYLSTREAQGFNSFYLMAIVHGGGYGEAPHAPNDLAGDPPFATPGDFSTAGATPASARYWEWIDTIIDRAAAHHMVVMLAYTYLGWSGGQMGWYQEILAQRDRQALYDWGLWLGNRYKDKPNIIWFGLGDFNPPAGSEGALRVRAIADGIKAAGAIQPFMSEPSPPDTLSTDVPDFKPVLGTNSFYGYGPDGIGTVYETADRAWRVSPPLPAWMQEGTYESENNWGHFSGKPWDTRRGRFWSVLAGGTAGDGFGSAEVWKWHDIPKSLSSPGATYATAAFNLFASLPWWALEPSGTDPGFTGVNLIPSGAGTWGKLDYITSARTTGHDWLLAYVPVTDKGARTFTVDMTAMAGPTRARWFDPATGDYLAISEGYSDANTGTKEFTTPGRRDDGTDDWLLVLDSSGPAPCGSISPSGVYTAPTAVPAGVDCEVTATLASDPSVTVDAAVTVRS